MLSRLATSQNNFRQTFFAFVKQVTLFTLFKDILNNVLIFARQAMFHNMSKRSNIAWPATSQNVNRQSKDSFYPVQKHT